MRKRLKKGVKMRLPIILAGEKGNPHAISSGHEQRLIKRWRSR